MVPDIVCGYKLLRELGTRALPAYAATDPKPRRPEDALCVVERLAREPGVNAEAAAVFMRDAKRLAQVRHPNLVHVRDVVVGTSTLLLVTDWLDGEVFSDIARMAAEQGIPIPLAGILSVMLDLLEGLSALHEVRDAKREPLQIVHAEVAPRNVVVGVDGRAVLVHPLHVPPDGKPNHAPDVIGYLAPEVLLGDQTADQRADVYGAGVILWEALMGQRMHGDGDDAGEIVMRILGGKIEPPRAPADAPWAAPLAEAAKKAVSPDPTVRFANATQMLAAFRHVVGARVAPKITVSALVEAVAGQRIRARYASLGVTRTRARLASESAWTTQAAAPIPTPQKTPSPVDLETTRRPPPSAPRPTSSRPRVTPSWGKVRTAPVSASSSSADPTLRTVDPGTGEVNSAPVSQPVASERLSAEIVEVVEMEVPPDKPSNPPALPPPVPPVRKPLSTGAQRPPPAPPPPPRSDAGAPHGDQLAEVEPPTLPPLDATLEPALTQSKTDMGSVRAPPAQGAAPPLGAKARWMIATACALVAAAVLWLLTRTSAVEDRGTDPVTSSTAASARPLSPAAAAIASATATPAHPSNDPSPFDPSPSDDPRSAEHAAPPANEALPASPPIPVVTPTAPTAPPPPAVPGLAPAGAAPATSSPHPKKRVYDPMGI